MEELKNAFDEINLNDKDDDVKDKMYLMEMGFSIIVEKIIDAMN